MQLRDRSDGGRRLAAVLAGAELDDPLVLALPRGGVPVALEVAVALGAPLDVIVARKVGAPGHQEYGIGAIAEGGSVVVDREAVAALGVSRDAFDAMVEDERRELERRVQRYRGARPLPSRPEEHTSELPSLMRISYAVYCLKKKNQNKT